MATATEADTLDVSTSTPLLPRPATVRSSRIRCLLACLLCLLERCTYYNYVPDLAVPHKHPNKQGETLSYCGMFDTGAHGAFELPSVSFNNVVHGLAYTLPVFGGFISDFRLGCAMTVRLASCLYVACSIGLCVMIYANYCEWWLQLVCTCLLSAAAGLIRPSILVMAVDALAELGFSLPAAIICYYAATSAGVLVAGCMTVVSDLLELPLTWFNICSALGLLACTLGARQSVRDSERDLEVFDWYLLWQHLKVAAPFIPLAFFVGTFVFALSGFEVAHYANASSWAEYSKYNDGMVCFYAVFLLLGSCLLLPSCLRFQPRSSMGPLSQSASSWHRRSISGFCLVSAVQLACMLLNFFGSKLHAQPPLTLLFTYGGLNGIAGLSEVLTIATLNEFSLRVANFGSRCFVSGFYISVWGSSFVFSIGLQALLHDKMNEEHPPLQFVYLGFLCLQLLGILYFCCVSAKLMQILPDFEQSEAEESGRVNA